MPDTKCFCSLFKLQPITNFWDIFCPSTENRSQRQSLKQNTWRIRRVLVKCHQHFVAILMAQFCQRSEQISNIFFTPVKASFVRECRKTGWTDFFGQLTRGTIKQKIGLRYFFPPRLFFIVHFLLAPPSSQLRASKAQGKFMFSCMPEPITGDSKNTLMS